MKIDWKRKLTSRKWWMAVSGMVTGIVMIFWGETTAEVIGGVIMDVASVIGYTIGEGLADSGHTETKADEAE